jgi:hypothetical protein
MKVLPMPKLTKRFVEYRLKPELLAWDDEGERVGVRVMPSGVRTYQVQYLKGGRTR